MLPWKIDSTWTLFLDRDGVINERIMGGYVTSPSEFHFLEHVPVAISKLNKQFNLIIVVTNQQGIAKNLMSTCNLDEVHRYMIEALNKVEAKVDKVYYAPGFKDEEDSIRKPNPGMGLLAKKDYPEIDFEKSIMIGDTDSDIKFGKNLGMKTVRVKTIEPINIEADVTVESLYEFSNLI